MRALLVAPYPRTRETHGEESLGGVASYTRGLAQALASHARLRVLAPVDGETVPPRMDGAVEVEEARRDASFATRLARAAEDADVVHVQFEQHLYGGPARNLRLLAALRRIRGGACRVVLTLHQVPDLDCVDRSFLSENGFPPFPRAARAWIRRQYAIAARASDLLVVHEAAFARRLRDQYGVDPARVAVVPHGVDRQRDLPAQADAKARLGLDPDRALVLYFGYVTGYKGVDLLAEALAAAPRAFRARTSVVVAGKVPERKLRAPAFREAAEAIERDIAALAPWVERKGFLSAEDVRLHLAAADVVVLPYRQALSASGPLHLAVGAGRAVVASDVFRGMGLPARALFAPRADALLAKLQAVVEDVSLAQALREAALARGREASWPRVAARTAALYARPVEVAA